MSAAGYARLAARGAAFGAGFALSAVLVAWGARELGALGGELRDLASPAAPARTVPAPTAAQSGAPPPVTSLTVASHRVERRHGDNVVLGVLRNDSGGTVRSVRIEASFHDAGGRLIDLCGWYVGTMIAPGEDKPFKVACGGTPEKPSPEAAAVRLRLVDGY
ncbi:MAG: hypothetical protein IT520_00255 [Burkholderiales bacterium]|nr:hypothetical protein [Burkholderiales bacterium]